MIKKENEITLKITCDADKFESILKIKALV